MFFKELYITIARAVQGWNPILTYFVLGFLTAGSFYTFAKFLSSNKAENGKINNTTVGFVMILFVFTLLFLISCMIYNFK